MAVLCCCLLNFLVLPFMFMCLMHQEWMFVKYRVCWHCPHMAHQLSQHLEKCPSVPIVLGSDIN